MSQKLILQIKPFPKIDIKKNLLEYLQHKLQINCNYSFVENNECLFVLVSNIQSQKQLGQQLNFSQFYYKKYVYWIFQREDLKPLSENVENVNAISISSNVKLLIALTNREHAIQLLDFHVMKCRENGKKLEFQLTFKNQTSENKFRDKFEQIQNHLYNGFQFILTERDDRDIESIISSSQAEDFSEQFY
ncbi:hypothetical protein PPERSA_07685 [Pseudocohnilembus persalinus]|uniref:Uncharacterized protein n=1 Tax=Pseudocohnilembus persalinus TaxID=266149 RepID=A0A0V0QIW5_PSEPJ|nr:hypothetical protein PPERSA_07685 [Pseudocohnilembus persalinus]|eukprot:KRX02040.1 hypothetical protein PPERSA_07685 [Pseudocohnilembus persalinus]